MSRADGSTVPTATGGRSRAILHALAVAAAALTWPLLLVGGSVTVYRVGMAVPDWPTTFGVNMFLYDFLNTSWGVFIEHSHRLYGAAVGLACLGLAVVATYSQVRPALGSFMIGAVATAGGLAAVPAVERAIGFGPFFSGLALVGALSLGIAIAAAAGRRDLLALAWLALAAVVAQGLLGGYRVRLNSTRLAFVHGCTAQGFFGLMVAIAVVAGRRWRDQGERFDDPDHLRRRAHWTLVLVAAQIVLGAWLRHYGEGPAVIAHAVLAVAVAGHAGALAVRVLRRRETVSTLVPAARAMLGLVGLQVAVGTLAWWLLRPFDGIPRAIWPAQALARIAHQGLGALLLASAVVLTLRAVRGLRSPAVTPRPQTAASRTALEAVA